MKREKFIEYSKEQSTYLSQTMHISLSLSLSLSVGLAILNQLAVRLKTVAKKQQVAVVVVNGVVQAGNLHHHTAKPNRWMPALGR